MIPSFDKTVNQSSIIAQWQIIGQSPLSKLLVDDDSSVAVSIALKDTQGGKCSLEPGQFAAQFGGSVGGQVLAGVVSPCKGVDS